MKLTYSQNRKLKSQSLELTQKADSLLNKKRPGALRREKLSELKESLRFSHLTDKDYFWNSIDNKFQHIRLKPSFLKRLKGKFKPKR